jgi:hypothetical protein
MGTFCIQEYKFSSDSEQLGSIITERLTFATFAPHAFQLKQTSKLIQTFTPEEMQTC